MKKILQVAQKYTQTCIGFAKEFGFVFLPSITLILGGLVTFMRPDLVVFVLALFFVTAGITAVFGTWKLLALRRKVLGMLSQFDGRILVKGMKIQEGQDPFTDSDPSDPTNQILH